MNAIADMKNVETLSKVRHQPLRPRVQGSPLINWWKSRGQSKAWYDRNINNGDLFIHMLELPVIRFQQSIFIEGTTELDERLRRLGFIISVHEDATGGKFSTLMVEHKFNLAVNLYKPEYGRLIKQAIEIASVFNDGEFARNVFVKSMKVLLVDHEQQAK